MVQFIFIIVLTQSAFAEDRIKFTEVEVRINAEKFLNTVFGEKPPTLADLLYFENHESPMETENKLLYALCKRKYKIANPEENKQCWDNVINPRYSNPSKYQSLYYGLIRKKLGVSVNQLKIKSVNWVEGHPEKYSGVFLVNVDVNDAKYYPPYLPPQIVLLHAPYHEYVVDGMVEVYSIVMPIYDYLGMRDM